MENKKTHTCMGCIWNTQCGGEYVCEYFSPLDPFDDELDDAYIDRIIEVGRQEFYEEWFEYIGEDGD